MSTLSLPEHNVEPCIDSSEQAINRFIGNYNLDHPDAQIHYRFVSKKDNTKALHLGQDEKFTIQGHRPVAVPLTLPLDFALSYDGDIVIEGDLTGGKEIRSGGSITVRGNVDGDITPKTPGDFKKIAERDEPHRLTLSAPNGNIIVKSDYRHSVQKTNLHAKKICAENYDFQNVSMSATSHGNDSIKVAASKNLRRGNAQLHYVDVKSTGSVELPDCYGCYVEAPHAKVTASDSKTRKNARVIGDFDAGAELKSVGERLSSFVCKHRERWQRDKAQNTLRM